MHKVALLLTTSLLVAACTGEPARSNLGGGAPTRADSLRALHEAVSTHVQFTATEPAIRLCDVPPDFATMVRDSLHYQGRPMQIVHGCPPADSTIALPGARLVIRLDSMLIGIDTAVVFFFGRAAAFEWREQLRLQKTSHNTWWTVHALLHTFEVE